MDAYRSLIPDVSPMESRDSLKCGPELDQIYLPTEYFYGQLNGEAGDAIYRRILESCCK